MLICFYLYVTDDEERLLELVTLADLIWPIRIKSSKNNDEPDHLCKTR